MQTDDVRTMVHTFVVKTEQGERIYTGHVSSRSPSTISVMLTEPFGMAGRVVKIPVEDVVSERRAA